MSNRSPTAVSDHPFVEMSLSAGAVSRPAVFASPPAIFQRRHATQSSPHSTMLLWRRQDRCRARAVVPPRSSPRNERVWRPSRFETLAIRPAARLLLRTSSRCCWHSLRQRYPTGQHSVRSLYRAAEMMDRPYPFHAAQTWDHSACLGVTGRQNSAGR